MNGSVDEDHARQVVQRIVAAGRRGYPRLLRQFERLLKLERERHRARVECAVPLTTDLQASVRRHIVSVYGPQVATEFAQNPCLIGGMRIQVGSDVYDGSIMSGLTALEKRFGLAGTNGTKRFISPKPQVEESGEAR